MSRWRHEFRCQDVSPNRITQICGNDSLLDEYLCPKLAYDRVKALYQAWADE